VRAQSKSHLSVVVAALVVVAAAPLPEWQSPLGREHPLVGTVWDVATGSALSPEALVAHLAAWRYVLLGEKHDNPDHHRLQAWIVRELIAAGRRPAIAFEMFRADQADAIARHLATSHGDARGLGEALDWRRSGWPAWSMYEPIVEAALRARLSLLAANLSETTTGALRRGGAAALDPGVAARLGLDRPLSDDVRQRITTDIRDGHCGRLPEPAVDSFVVVQRARDAHMAAAMREAGGDGAVLIAGVGHVRRDVGVPRALPDGEVASLALLEARADMRAPPVLAVDYVWLTPRVDDRDPCERFRRDLERLRRP
jgi:uncharacterized iron-regulated protein